MEMALQGSWLAHALNRRDGDGEEFTRRHHQQADTTNASRSCDAALVDRIRQGDNSAFTQIVADTVPALIQYANRRLHDEARAADVVQDVLARLWDRRTTLTVATSVRAYLFGAVRNAIANVYKHDGIVEAHASDVVATESGTVDTTHPVLERLTVEQLLSHLPERRREAVILRYLGELTYAEIASTLETTPVNAERLVARALETLRRVVERPPGQSGEGHV